MRPLASVFCFTLLASGVVYFLRNRELRTLRERPPTPALLAPPDAVRTAPSDERVDSSSVDLLADAPGRERLTRLLAQQHKRLNDEDVSLVLALTESSDPEVLAALARTAASLKLDEGERRRLYRALANLTKNLSDEQAARVLLALSPISRESGRDLEARIRPWFLKDPKKCAAWLSLAITGGELDSFSESDRAGMAGFVRLGKVLGDPMAHLEGIRSMDRSEQTLLVTEGMKQVASAGDRRTLAGIGVAGASPSDMPAILSYVVQDSGIEEAAKWLADLELPDEARRAAALTALATGIKENPDTAQNADRVLNVLKADDRNAFAAALVKEWAARDHEATAGWINRNGNGPWQDRAREEFSRSIFTSGEPRAALLWVASIADPGRRAAVAQELFRNWNGDAPALAREFLQSAECPGDLAEAMKRELER